jgi:hypothetical protein
MFKKLCSLLVLLFVTISHFSVNACRYVPNNTQSNIEYDIQDIGTLQTHSSQAIAINNQGQILGWYNIDGSINGKHFFVRDRDGIFHELLNKENGIGCEIDWRYLTDNGKAYGTFEGNATYAVLYVWDQKNGVVKLGNLPGKEIATINNAGQVLIKSIVENENGKSVRRPVIWENGKIIKLRGLEGGFGIESEESYGFGMNNNGEVVGQSVVHIIYKNNLYKQVHATKWSNGQAINIHTNIPKNSESKAIAINDIGDVLISSGHNTIYYVRNDGEISVFDGFQKSLNNKYICSDKHVCDRNKILITNIMKIRQSIMDNKDSILMGLSKIVNINNDGEIIAQGETLYGEQHAILLTPVKSK